MNSNQPVILVVDDEPYNLEIIAEYLADSDYSLVLAESGDEAWALLQAEPEKYNVVLLDRMMPGMDGMELLHNIKRSPRLKMLPVIMQTAASTPEQVAEGLRAGAFYYLAKPFAPEVMRAVVATAVRDYIETALGREDADKKLRACELLDEALFTFRTTDEAQQLALMLSSLCPSRESAYVGLMELMLNAVEHGNLGITYDEKTRLIADDRLRGEVARRLSLPELASKHVTVRFRRDVRNLIFNIADQGDGFDWEPYLEMSLERMMDNHGRGIAMSRSIAFSSLTYIGKGNVVEAVVSAEAA